MKRSFARVAAAAALTVVATSCSTGTQVRNSSLDECCHLVQGDQPPDASEVVWCYNKCKKDLVDKNVKNDDKGKHVCGVKESGAGGSDTTAPPPDSAAPDDTTPRDTTPPVSTPVSIPSDSSVAPVTDSSTPSSSGSGGTPTPSTVIDALVNDEDVVVILPVREVYKRVQPGPEKKTDPVTAVVDTQVDTVTVTPDQAGGLVDDTEVQNGRLYVRPVVKGGAGGAGPVRETVAGEWQEVNPDEGVSVRIGSGAPTVEFQVRPADGGTEGAVTVAVDVQRVDGSGEGTGSGTVTRSFNWWWLLLLVLL
ncbi:MAG: hypothetical protein ACKOD2_10010, partial [Ilumatobacteraceae bacterium]